MVKYIVKKAMEIKINTIYLKVMKSNERAVKLYLKNGFQIFEDYGEYLNMIRTEV